MPYDQYVETERAGMYTLRECKSVKTADPKALVEAYRCCYENDCTQLRTKQFGLKPAKEAIAEEVAEIMTRLGLSGKSETEQARMGEYMVPDETGKVIRLPPPPTIFCQALRAAELNGIPCRGLVDSGAQASCITSNVVDFLEKIQETKFPRVDHRIEIIGFSEAAKPVVSKKVVMINTKVNNWSQPTPFLLIEDAKEDMIIWGNNMLSIFGIAGMLAPAVMDLKATAETPGFLMGRDVKVRRSLVDNASISRRSLWNAMLEHGDFQQKVKPPIPLEMVEQLHKTRQLQMKQNKFTFDSDDDFDTIKVDTEKQHSLRLAEYSEAKLAAKAAK